MAASPGSVYARSFRAPSPGGRGMPGPAVHPGRPGSGRSEACPPPPPRGAGAGRGRRDRRRRSGHCVALVHQALHEEVLYEQGKAGPGVMRPRPSALEAGRGQGHEIGDGREVPVGVADLRMAEVGRQGRQLHVDIASFLMPGEQFPARKGVAEIVNPGSTPPAAGDPGQSSAKLREDPEHGPVRQRQATLRQKEGVPRESGMGRSRCFA